MEGEAGEDPYWQEAAVDDPFPDFWQGSPVHRANQPYRAQYEEDDQDAWQEFTGVATELDFGQGVRSGAQHVKKEDHDRPPKWDGKDPEKGARTFIRLLRMWLTTTAVPKKWQVTVIWQSVLGDLRDIIDRLDNDEIMSETGAEKLLATFESIYEEWLTPDLPETLEKYFYDKESQHRKKGEQVTMYINRREQNWAMLEKFGIKFDSQFKGYSLVRDAGFSFAQKGWV